VCLRKHYRTPSRTINNFPLSKKSHPNNKKHPIQQKEKKSEIFNHFRQKR